MSKTYLIASDLHGDAVCTERLLARLDAEGAEKLILLGDLLYHGPRNALPSGYDPQRLAALLNERAERLLCVRGNCDSEVDQMMLHFPMLADYAYLEFDGLCLFATHGHRFGPQSLPPMRAGEILLTGHTHVPAATPLENGGFYLNPGSVSIPKEGSPKSYLRYRDGRFVFCRLEDGEEYRRFEVPIQF